MRTALLRCGGIVTSAIKRSTASFDISSQPIYLLDAKTQLLNVRPSGSSASNVEIEERESLHRKAKINRLLYRSKQRGFLEMDLLLGLWAQNHVHTASPQLLQAFEELLELENPELFKWLTGQEEAPTDLQQNLAFKAVQDSVRGQLNHIVKDAAKTDPGKAWVRGWDDWKKDAFQSQTNGKEGVS